MLEAPGRPLIRTAPRSRHDPPENYPQKPEPASLSVVPAPRGSLMLTHAHKTDLDGRRFRSPRKLARAIIHGAVILVDGDTVVVGKHVVVS